MFDFLPSSPLVNIAIGIVLALFVLPRIFLFVGNRNSKKA